MNYFLHGFSTELVKVGAVSTLTGTNYARDTNRTPGAATPAPPKPPAAAKPGSVAPSPSFTPKAMQPQKALANGPAKVGGWNSQIGQQRMESPAAAAKPQRFRPSPSFKPDTSSDPVIPKKSVGGGGSKQKAAVTERKRLPFENNQEMIKRRAGEAAHNTQRAAAKTKASQPNTGTPVAQYNTGRNRVARQPRESAIMRPSGLNAAKSIIAASERMNRQKLKL